MQGVVNILAVGGMLMTVLLVFLLIKVVSGGLKRRASGLAEGLPRWRGVPAGWVSVTTQTVLDQEHVPWPEGEWATRIAAQMPDGHPDRPHLSLLDTGQGHLLYLPGRNRGVNGWWVVLLGVE